MNIASSEPMNVAAVAAVAHAIAGMLDNRAGVVDNLNFSN